MDVFQKYAYNLINGYKLKFEFGIMKWSVMKHYLVVK